MHVLEDSIVKADSTEIGVVMAGLTPDGILGFLYIDRPLVILEHLAVLVVVVYVPLVDALRHVCKVRDALVLQGCHLWIIVYRLNRLASYRIALVVHVE